jgi:hypothetical protein
VVDGGTKGKNESVEEVEWEVEKVLGGEGLFANGA